MIVHELQEEFHIFFDENDKAFNIRCLHGGTTCGGRTLLAQGVTRATMAATERREREQMIMDK